MTNEKSKVVLRGVTGTSVFSAVQQCLERCEWQSWVPSGATLVLKPNVCTAVAKIVDVANTSVEVTAAACEVLRTRARKIYIVEANHMRETAWQAFEASGYVEMAKRLDVELVNLSEQPLVPVHCDPVGPIALWPSMLECDAFITLPVLKTHALTYFTGSLKNQWGCVPNYQDRIYHHTKINQLLPTLHRIFKPKLSLMDATTAMEGRGPVAGQRRKMDLILASRDGVALDVSAMRLVGLDPQRCRHVMLAAKQGLGRTKPEEIEIDGDWGRFATKFEAPPVDVANRAMFYLGRYPWFVKNILANDKLYYPVANFVKMLRRAKVLGG